MPSSRGSSPLSSATPSPDPQRSGLPAETSHDGPSDTADRDDRSQTSSTVVLSNLSDSDDESDLTEEDEGSNQRHQEDDSAQSSARRPKQIVPNVEEEEEGMEIEFDIPFATSSPDRKLDEKQSLSERALSRLEAEDETLKENPASPEETLRSSPSLTPPPPSVKHQPRELPVIGSIRPPLDQSDDDDLSDPEEEMSENEQDGEDGEEEEGDEAHDDGGQQADAEEERDANGNGVVDSHTMEGDGAEAPGGNEAEDDAMEVTEDGAGAGAEVRDEAVEEEAGLPGVDIQVEAPGEEMSEAGDVEHEAAGALPHCVRVLMTDTAVQQPTRPHHSSHAPPPSQAHMRELFRLELKFAALRDQLYVERMEEVAAEEQMILDGTHPALQYLYKSLSDRRERLHEVASRRHQEAKEELKRARESEKNHTWSWWTEQRDQLHWDEFEATWSKRRRLAREKNEIETPRTVKPVPRAGGRIRNFDWSAGAAPTKMSLDDASADLAVMENRPVAPAHMAHMSRLVSPVVYAPPAAQPIHASPAAIALSSPPNGLGHRPPAPISQPAPSFAYNSSNHLSYNISRTTQPAQPATTAVSRPPAPSRPQGRTVPTTSDLFESGRKDPTSPAWKPEPMRPANGLSKDALGLTTNPVTTAIPPKTEDRPISRFPGLSEYLNSASQRPAGVSVSGNGYGGVGNPANKILSPPKSTTTTGLLGSFGRPGTFGTTPSASATPAGTTMNRP